MYVTIGDVDVVDGFPELREATDVLVAPLRAQRVSAAELYQLAAAIEELYRQEGYLLVRVTLPPQSVGDGETLKLQVIDGFIESIDLDGVPARARRSVRRHLEPLIGQRKLRVDTVERLVTLAGRAPGVRLRSALDAGDQLGGVRLILDGDHQLFSSGYSTNNRLSEGLGKWDHTFRLTFDQLLGRGEQLYTYLSGGSDFFNALTLKGERRIVGGGITLPIGADGFSLNLEYTRSITSPEPVAIWVPRLESRFERYSLRLSYPLILSRRQALTLTTALEAMDQQDSFPDFFGFVLSEDRLRVLRLSADWTLPVANGALAWNTTLSQGIDAFGARGEVDVSESGIGFSRPGAAPNFVKLDTTLVYDLPLPRGFGSRFVLRGQIPLNGVMPSAELFSLEGEQALSSFRAGALASDAGWSLREEIVRPVGIRELHLSPFVYAAVGRLSSRQPGTPYGRDSLAYGLGLRAFWRSFDLAMEYGHYDAHPGGLDGEQFFVRGGMQF